MREKKKKHEREVKLRPGRQRERERRNKWIETRERLWSKRGEKLTNSIPSDNLREGMEEERERERPCRIEEVKESGYGDRPGDVMHHVIEL